VFPSDAAIEWFMTTPTPPDVDDYLARLEKQQRAIREVCNP
jgi:hypothetical protein